MSFAPVRLDGGGCCNVQAISPDGSVLLAGSDTQGYYTTATSPFGNKWLVQNTGIGNKQFTRQCAALCWSKTETSPQVVYSLTGEKQAQGTVGNSGGLMAGTLDSGGTLHWAMRSTVPQAAANGVNPPLPSIGGGAGWQRSTGRLLIQDSSFLFAGTYQQGILRSSNTGTDGTNTGPGYDGFPVAVQMGGVAPGVGNWFCRAMCYDLTNFPAGTQFYAGFYDVSGNATALYKCVNAHAGTPNMTAVSMTGGPSQAIEDIFQIGDYLYCACAGDGVYRYGPLSGGPAWANLNGASVPTGSGTGNWWMTVAGFTDGSGNHVLMIGDSNPAQGAGLAKTIIQLTVPPNYPTGSITYANQTGSVQITTVPTVGGSYTWWIPVAGLGVYLGGGGYICPQVNVDATNPAAPNWYASGSGGAYRKIGAGGWTVANSGMPMFLGHPVAASPTRKDQIVWGNSDWYGFDDKAANGTENATTLVRQVNNSLAGTEGFSMAFSADGNTVYTGQGQKYTNSGGEVWSRAWNQPTTWTAMGLGAKTGGKVAIGLAALTDTSAGNAQVVLAAVWGSGLWRYDGSAWTNRAAAIGASGSAGNQIPVTYYGSGLCFVYDRKTGVYRSTDFGKTWVLVWAKTSSDYLSGTVAYDVTRPGRLWVSTAGKLYQLSGADTGTVTGGGVTGTGHDVTPTGTSAGPLGTDGSGTIILATQDNGTGSGVLSTGDDGATWTDITGGDGSFARCNCNPEFIAIGPPDPAQGNQPRIYVSGSNVVAQGFAASSAPPPVSAPFTEVQVSGNILGASGALPLWFSQAGGTGTQGSQVGSLLVARIETTTQAATITAPAGWLLAADESSGVGTGVTRVLIYYYPDNPGNLGAPAPVVAGGAAGGPPRALAFASGAMARARFTANPGVSTGNVAATPITFTSSDSSATIKGKLAEYSTPPGTVQALDQTGVNAAASASNSPSVTASAANTYTGGLAVVNFGNSWSPQPSGQTWTAPGGWTGDGTGNNVALAFAHYYQTGLTAGPTAVTGTVNPGSGGTMTSWAAALATFYALPTTPVTITTASLPNGTPSVPYNATLAASGGATPYAWAVTSGTLPTGLSLSTSGVITGTPSTGGTYSFSVTVTDASAQTATAPFTITIAGALSVTTSSLPNGTLGAGYLQFLAATGGSPPYTWAIVAGALPPGLALTSGNGPGAGTIAGTPLAAGTFSFTAQATDRLAATAAAALSITIPSTAPLTITTLTLAPGKLGQPYTAQFEATGGTPPYHWAVTAGTLPPGLALSDDGSVTGTLLALGDYPFTVTVTDT